MKEIPVSRARDIAAWIAADARFTSSDRRTAKGYLVDIKAAESIANILKRRDIDEPFRMLMPPEDVGRFAERLQAYAESNNCHAPAAMLREFFDRPASQSTRDARDRRTYREACGLAFLQVAKSDVHGGRKPAKLRIYDDFVRDGVTVDVIEAIMALRAFIEPDGWSNDPAKLKKELHAQERRRTTRKPRVS